jgi:hypothetical protein
VRLRSIGKGLKGRKNGDEEGRIKMKKAILVISLFLFIAVVKHQLVNAQDFYGFSKKSKSSLNGLEVSDYKKVRIKINMQGSSANKIGLTEENIREICELRLRQSGLQLVVSEEPVDCLVIVIQVIPRAFSIRSEFYRGILFEVKGEPYFTVASTWENWGTGTHADRPEYIIRMLDQHFDAFLKDYLKANAK